MEQSGKLKQSFMMIITIGIALFFLSIYFFVYVVKKEEYVNRRNFKALARVAHNLDSKIKEYATQHITRNVLENNIRKIDCPISSIQCISAQLTSKSQGNLNINVRKLSPVLKCPKPKPEKDILKIELEQSEWRFVFEDTIVWKKSINNENQCTKKDTIFKTESYITAYDFITPEIRLDFFEDYLILNLDTPTPNKVIFETNPLGITDTVTQILIKNQIKIIELKGVKYHAFSYPFLFFGKPWILVGLQNQESYTAETRSFDRPLLYIIVLITLLLVLALPMIKIIFISKNEKLNKADITLTGLSLLLGCYFCTLMIIRLDFKRLYHPDRIKELSGRIEKEFKKEIKELHDLLISSNEKFKFMTSPGDDVLYFDSVNNKLQGTLVVFWSNAEGQQIYKWTTERTITNKINIAERAYFRNFNEGKAWWNPFDSEYVLESIRSWNESEKKAALSVRSNAHDSYVVCVAKKLKSVIEPVLPLGYKFCITDQLGNVWFHSDVNRNLNENIFEECNIPEGSREIFYNKYNGNTWIYENKEHAVFVKPMNDFPLLLITMKDLTQDQESQAFALEVTFAFLTLHFLVILMTIGIITFTHKSSVRTLSFDWLKPDEEKTSLYRKIVIINALIFLFIIIAILLDSFNPVEELFLLVSIPVCILPLYFYYLNTPSVKNYYTSVNNKVIVWAIVSLIILDITFMLFVEKLSLALMGIAYLQLMVMVVGLLLLSRKSRSDRKNEDNRWGYSLALFSTLIIIGVMPSVTAFRHAFNYERTIHAMATQLDMARHHYTKEGGRKSNTALVYKWNTVDTCKQMLIPLELDIPFRQLAFFASKTTKRNSFDLMKADSSFYTYVGNTPWSWKKGSDAIEFSQVNPEKHDPIIPFTSALSKFNLGLDGFGVLIAGALAIVYLFMLIKFLAPRVFLFTMYKNLFEADYDLLQKNKNPLRVSSGNEKKDNTIFNHLFLVGLPFSGKQEYINKLYPPEDGKRCPVNIIDLQLNNSWSAMVDKACGATYEVIIIDHFEYDLENGSINNNKLELLEKLLLKGKKKIVVVSTVHPAQIFETRVRMTNKMRTRWNAVLAHFYQIIYPLQKDEDYKRVDEEKRAGYRSLYKFIEIECSHGLYLQNLKPTLYNLVDSEKAELSIAELVVKIKSLAHTYYISLWNSCSPEEQHLIYDLAEDGLVNTKNVEAITRLIYKGVFLRTNSLSLMNASFRDFVLTHIDPREAHILRNKVSKNGTWNKMRLSLFFLLALMALFLLYTQKGFSSQIMGFVTALAAIIPLLFRIFEGVSGAIKAKT